MSKFVIPLLVFSALKLFVSRGRVYVCWREMPSTWRSASFANAMAAQSYASNLRLKGVKDVYISDRKCTSQV